MTGLGIALSLLMAWALGLGAIGAYWVRKEKLDAKRRRSAQTPWLPFANQTPTYVSREEPHEVATR